MAKILSRKVKCSIVPCMRPPVRGPGARSGISINGRRAASSTIPPEGAEVVVAPGATLSRA